jgi:CRISPR-associated protein Cmr2
LPKEKYHRFCALTRRPSQIQQVDRKLYDGKSGYNGVMFSAKWLADDIGLEHSSAEMQMLRSAVDQAHMEAKFGDASPADWWVLVLGDGDSMGKYVSGSKLKNYEDYLTCSPSDLAGITNISNEALEKLGTTQKRMGPATHIGLNRALIDFSNRLVPYLTEERCCGRVIYSGGDDVMAALPLGDLPLFLRSLRAAWSGKADPCDEFEQSSDPGGDSGYWIPHSEAAKEKLPNRPLFTMGDGATMSLGIIVAHKSVPLPTVLENLWEAEKDRAKKMLGYDSEESTGKTDEHKEKSCDKNGLCFRVVYGSGNVLEALMKGHLLEGWWKWIQPCLDDSSIALAPLLYRLAEELPRHCEVTSHLHLFREATKVILLSRDNPIPELQQEDLMKWVDQWETWAWGVIQQHKNTLGQDDKAPLIYPLGTSPQEFADLLRFSAFWVGRQQQELTWVK